MGVLKGGVKLASENSPQKYRTCLQLGCEGVISVHFDKSLTPGGLVAFFPEAAILTCI